MRFMDDLVGRNVSLIFGSNVYALVGTVVSLEKDFVVFDTPKGEEYIVPLKSILYVKIND